MLRLTGTRGAMTVVLSLWLCCDESLLADDLAPGQPRYADDGQLVRPAGYETWVFVGAALGLSYSEKEDPYDSQQFTNVYIAPGAYQHYASTGQFPEGTMFVMAVYKQSRKPAGLPRLQGSFEGELVSLEVAVKDSERFEESWAYFDFSEGDAPAETAKAFPRSKCYDCHAEHAIDDHVFVQFYPVLRRLRKTDTSAP